MVSLSEGWTGCPSRAMYKEGVVADFPVERIGTGFKFASFPKKVCLMCGVAGWAEHRREVDKLNASKVSCITGKDQGGNTWTFQH